jgi:hypothetical protein
LSYRERRWRLASAFEGLISWHGVAVVTARTIRLKAGVFVCDDTLPGAQRQAKSSSQEFPKRAHFVRVEPRELDSSIQHRPAWNGRDAVKCLAFQRVRVL